MSGQTVNPKVAGYAADVAQALEGLLERECGFGAFYISSVKFGFDGEDSGVEITPDEFGGVSIKITGSPSA